MLRAWLLLPLLLLPLPAAPMAAEHPVRVTTDSSAYCEELSARFEEQPGAAPGEARALAEEGRKLCETGFVRTGIAKLRRALRAARATGG
ncbi:hypothetical protein [Falsiroseomonas sp.]|uniref:hypothetical protein n=1 Tax=Falsiroseomonas sp. TaxID=2870721 RepID=UPI00356132E7